MVPSVYRRGDGTVIAQRSSRFGAQFVLLVALSLTIAACSSPQMVFVDDGNSYDLGSISKLLATVDRPSIEGRDIDEASDLRREALIELRSQGQDATELAEFVTRTLPDNGRSVPYYGEAAVTDGSDTWVLLEMWGPESGVLDHARIWVFDRATGDVLYSSSSQ